VLRTLNLRNVGPSNELAIEFGDRLNVIIGDSGLGKSFLLDVAWWALTRSWAASQALPNKGAEREATLGYRIGGNTAPVEAEIDFNVKRQGWFHGSGRPPIGGLVVYARVDGSFAVMDPARNEPPDDDGAGAPASRRRPAAFFFNSDQVWGGLTNDGQRLCNGLIADWRVWQLENSDEFKALENMLSVLSPEPGEPLQPGEPRRIDLLDSRDIPTLRMPYGEVPVTLLSAGVRRILALSYLLVWAWHEHRKASELRGDPPSDRVTVLIDDVEAHLDSRRQRAILPAILKALQGLGASADSQVISTTHSPLVLASLEGLWEEKHDRLFKLDLVSSNESAARLSRHLSRQSGEINGGITPRSISIFSLTRARAREACAISHQPTRGFWYDR
jgi:hypothetical protein